MASDEREMLEASKVVCGSGPDERVAAFVPAVDEAADRCRLELARIGGVLGVS